MCLTGLTQAPLANALHHIDALIYRSVLEFGTVLSMFHYALHHCTTKVTLVTLVNFPVSLQLKTSIAIARDYIQFLHLRHINEVCTKHVGANSVCITDIPL